MPARRRAEAMIMEEIKFVHQYGASDLPAKIKLMRMSKGYWQWEISLLGTNLEDLIHAIDDANEIMKAKYGNNSNAEAGP